MSLNPLVILPAGVLGNRSLQTQARPTGGQLGPPQMSQTFRFFCAAGGTSHRAGPT